MRTLSTRIEWLKARAGTSQAEVNTDRSAWDWYADSCSCGLPAGECSASPRPADAAAACGRLASLGLCGRPRRGQDAGRGFVDSAEGRRRNHEARLPDRSDRSRHPRRHGRGPVRALERCAPVEPASVRVFETPRRMAQRSSRGLLERRGARACRGLNVDTLWADELACWQRAESTWDLAMLALRAGTKPQALITTTPRRLSVLRRILAEASTVQTSDTTYANQAHLPKEFLSQIVSLYENTKLGRQEIYAEFLETTDGVWFTGFDPARHVSIDAEYHPAYFVRCAIDAGTSRHTAAVFFQVRSSPSSDRPRVTVFADYHAQDVVSLKNACAIKSLADQLPCRGRIDQVRVDPAATARSSLGPAAYSEYERVFGSRIIARWPQHLVLDGLDTIEGLLDTGNLVIHPRCTHLKEAFRNYCRQRRGGQWVDFPADGHPEEDLMDALRGGIRDALPDGNALAPCLPRVHASMVQ